MISGLFLIFFDHVISIFLMSTKVSTITDHSCIIYLFARFLTLPDFASISSAAPVRRVD